MKNNSLLMPLFKTIDKLLFGIEDINDVEKPADNMVCDNEEKFDIDNQAING